MSSNEGGPPRKKMRKGTHSCWECRRRKIRCIFPPEHPAICSECFARGSRCVDQEAVETDVVVDQRKNLRERVARLESLVDTLLEDRSDRGAAEVLRDLRSSSSRLPPTPGSNIETPLGPGPQEVPGHTEQMPIYQLFNNEVLSSARNTVPVNHSTRNSPERSTHGPHVRQSLADEATSLSTLAKSKHEHTRQVLLSVMPSSEGKLWLLLEKARTWWTFFRQKCPGTTGRIDFLDYAGRVLHSTRKPAELGILVIAAGVASGTDNIERYLAVVDKEIVSDDEYMGTLEGLECAFLVGKSYADIGQPRRAWLSVRRALTFAQLMGLHKTHGSTPERDSLFWALFQADRFISLLLGLPYGLADSHVVMEMNGRPLKDVCTPVAFIVKLCILSGRVIDRTQGAGDHLFSETLDLDAQLDRLAAEMPAEWWNIPSSPPSLDPAVTHEWQEQALSQAAFHQIRIYLHMPFMLRSAVNPRFEYSRTACFEGARELLQLYHMIREEGKPLYECKAVDFLGFTAALLLLLGILGYGRLAPMPNPQQEAADCILIDKSMDIFRRASTEKGGKVAQESLRVLEQLSAVRDRNISGPEDDPSCAAKIAIPYFGTLSVRRGEKFNHITSCSGASSTTQETPLLTPGSSLSSGLDNTGYSSFDPLIAYDGLYMPHDQQQFPEDPVANPLAANYGYNGLTGLAGLDIDQDWSWFMGDVQQQFAG